MNHCKLIVWHIERSTRGLNRFFPEKPRTKQVSFVDDNNNNNNNYC